MQRLNLKQIVLLLGFLLPAVWCGANGTSLLDGHSHIIIMAGNLQGIPKNSSIQATINGHCLAVVFTENLGQVSIEIATAAGTSIEYTSILTPNGLQIYIPN